MKKFLINILIFLCLAVAYDILLGAGLDYMAEKARSGQALKNKEIADEITPDILILGSSRGVYHYVPERMEAALHRKVYVAAQYGQGIVMMNPVLHHICARHKPEIVIYDITSKYDLKDDDPHTYLHYLRMLRHRDGYTDSLLRRIDPIEPIKLKSRLYGYNSSLPSLIKGVLTNDKEFHNGHKPLYGIMDTTRPDFFMRTPVSEMSELKLSLFRETADYCRANGIRLYLAISPFYSYCNHPEERDPGIDSLIRALGTDVMNFSSSPYFRDARYYHDGAHLNRTGAEAYTDSITGRLKVLLGE